jgi:exodeoxyribonuclease III
VLGIPADEHHVRLGIARPRPSSKRYHLAVASRWPIRSVRTHNDPCFLGHCLLQCELESQHGPVMLFGAHFDAHHENLRFVEARYLRSLIDPVAFREKLFLLLGDLNSLSRRDPYPEDFAERVRRAGTIKYGQPPRFEVIEELEDFGWVDTLRSRSSSPRWVTALRERGGETIEYRTDYIFASPRMAEQLVRAEVVEVGGASDHHALCATFRVG